MYSSTSSSSGVGQSAELKLAARSSGVEQIAASEKRSAATEAPTTAASTTAGKKPEVALPFGSPMHWALGMVRDGNVTGLAGSTLKIPDDGLDMKRIVESRVLFQPVHCLRVLIAIMNNVDEMLISLIDPKVADSDQGLGDFDQILPDEVTYVISQDVDMSDSDDCVQELTARRPNVGSEKNERRNVRLAMWQERRR